jgi:asparaginyl-tRNA synthetase
MQRAKINELFNSKESYADKLITVAGWVRTIRDSKALGFMAINDGSYFTNLQIVFEADKIDNYSEIAHLNVGAAVIVTGKFILTPDANQPFEINADSIQVEGESAPDYPLQKKKHSLEYLREI